MKAAPKRSSFFNTMFLKIIHSVFQAKTLCYIIIL